MESYFSKEEFSENYGEIKIYFSNEYCLELNKLNNIEMEDIPIYYGSHYSNPVYIYHYLTRIFPYSNLS